MCGCGSEADNMALRTALVGTSGSVGSRPHVIASNIEHPAISVCLNAMEKNKEIELTYIKVDNEGLHSTRIFTLITILTLRPYPSPEHKPNEGIVDPAAVASAVRPNTVLVSVMHSNNEVVCT